MLGFMTGHGMGYIHHCAGHGMGYLVYYITVRGTWNGIIVHYLIDRYITVQDMEWNNSTLPDMEWNNSTMNRYRQTYQRYQQMTSQKKTVRGNCVATMEKKGGKD